MFANVFTNGLPTVLDNLVSKLRIPTDPKITFAVGLLAIAVTAFVSPNVIEVEANSARVSVVNGVTAVDQHRFTGHLVEHYASGQVKTDAVYRHGKLHSLARGWFENGQLSYARTYADGLEDGWHRGWYDNGSRRFEYTFRAGNSEGVEQQWYVDGQLYTRFHYVNGQEEGQQQMWSSDGKLRANYVIRNGRRFGLPGSTGCRGTAS